MVIGGDEVTNSAREFALHGVDVSEYQQPSAIPLDADFMLIRASIGDRADKRFALHVAQALQLGTRWAPYHFFYPGTSLTAQRDVLLEQLRVVGHGRGGGIPWLDTEDTSGNGKNPPTEAWADPLEQLAELVSEELGACGNYLDQFTFSRLGSPAWILEGPLWAPHWRTTPGAPATAGDIVPTIWQYRVGQWHSGALHAGEQAAPEAIDHNCLVGKWPVVGAKLETTRAILPPATLTEAEHSEMRAARACLWRAP